MSRSRSEGKNYLLPAEIEMYWDYNNIITLNSGISMVYKVYDWDKLKFIWGVGTFREQIFCSQTYFVLVTVAFIY
jgi:hypothetical protein